MKRRKDSEGTKSKHIVWEKYHEPRLEVHQLIIENMDWTDVRNLLDVGCGFGEFLERVKRKLPEIDIVGLDIDRRLIKEASRKLPADLLLCDVEAGLPFKDNSFDCVTAIQILEHVSNPTFLINEVKRVCRKKAVFVVPNIGRPSRMLSAMRGKEIREVEGHKQGWDYHLFKQVLEVNGWEVEKILTRFVDFPLYRWFPKSFGRFMSYKVLHRLFPRIGSELFAFCRKRK